MFTGIVEELGIIKTVQPGNMVVYANDVLQEIELGASIAINGACLTVTGFNANSFSVDVMPETLDRTNLGLLKAGDKVNLERPLTLGGRLGGHLVQGHIDATGRITSKTWDGQAMVIEFEAPPQVMRYLVEKGFIAIDGISLTVANVSISSFKVSIVNYTRKHTTMDNKLVGNLVNLEVDILAKYVEWLGQVRTPGITTEFLKKHGFLVS